MIDFDLSGQTAIVTGTSGNLGPVWIEALDEAGIMVFDFDLPKFDVMNIEQINYFFNELSEGIKNDDWAFRDVHPIGDFNYVGHWPDILINNAGIDNPPGTDAKIFKNWDEILAVNLTGAKNMIKAVLPGMVERGKGHIINIGSMYGLVSPDQSLYPDDFEKPAAYSVSKAGLLHLTRLMAAQFGKHGVRCNCLTLGPVYSRSHDSEFRKKMYARIPLERMANKQDLKRALWGILMADYANGANFVHDGGYTCL